MKLKGRVAIVTGAGTGIGRACAELFAAEGAAVVLAGRRVELLQQAVEGIQKRGGRALAQPCDVTRASQVEELVRRGLAEFGGLHIVVNNAGYWMAGSAEETSEEEWDRVMDTNLKGAFLVSKAAVTALRRAGGGSIINIGSILSLVGMKRRAAYTASKGGLAMLTKAMALDHAGENMRVNCICPGLVETPLAQQALAQFSDPEAERARRLAGIPLGRIGRPEDVARLALVSGERGFELDDRRGRPARRRLHRVLGRMWKGRSSPRFTSLMRLPLSARRRRRRSGWRCTSTLSRGPASSPRRRCSTAVRSLSLL